MGCCMGKFSFLKSQEHTYLDDRQEHTDLDKRQEHTHEEEKIDFEGGNVHVITSKEDWDQKMADANKDGKIVNKPTPALVFFLRVVANFSASWCAPCRSMSPVYAEMSQTYPQLMFLTVDVNELMDFKSSWDIQTTPTFLFLKSGQQMDKLVGNKKDELGKKLAALADGV